MDVVRIDFAKLVRRHLAEKGRTAAETGYAGSSIARTAARSLDCRTHAAVEKLGAVPVDQVHCALDDAIVDQEGVVALGNDVNDGIANAKHVVLAHEVLREGRHSRLQ
jgi:hypothetical protein